MEPHDERKPLGYWLKLVDSLINEQFAVSLDEHGITRLQWQLLNSLAQEPATLRQLSHRLAPFLAPTPDDEPDTIAEHLAELVDSGWVTDAAGSLTLTDQGRLGWEKLDETVAGMREASGEGIPREDYATTVRTLHRMAINLGWNDSTAEGDN
ncbi:hypothetical protein GCM10022377_24190 [Zhihengliuella alba]|uniref:MarR family transcriptional regulator n=1 Tax=Zhihengliuella alba TaxID=547018 RepID=A0ABP7DV70_9MICC